MSAYFGIQAENAFKQNLQYQSKTLDEKGFQLELVEYKKHFLGSSAIIRVSSDVSFINNWLSDFTLNVSSLNGPFFITKKGLDFGASRWFIRLDPESFSVQAKEKIKSIFPQAFPHAVVIVGFEKESTLYASLQTAWLDTTVTGFYDLTTFSYRGALDITGLNYASPSLDLSADMASVNIQYPNTETVESNIARVSSNTASIRIPQLTIKHALLTEPIVVSVKGNNKITIKNNRVDSFINIQFTNKNSSSTAQSERLPIDTLTVSSEIKGIQPERFIELMEAKAELDNLSFQAQWELEEQGELPEGQDKIWQLQNQIVTLNKQYPATVYNVIFPINAAIKAGINDKTSFSNRNIRFELKSSNKQGKSTLKGFLKPAANSGLYSESGVFFNGDSSIGFADLIEAEAKVLLDERLYHYLSKHSPVTKKKFLLLFEQNKLLMY